MGMTERRRVSERKAEVIESEKKTERATWWKRGKRQRFPVCVYSRTSAIWSNNVIPMERRNICIQNKLNLIIAKKNF